MFLSIIIPTFNRVNDLTKCIDSIFNQTKLPNEVIIIDSGDDSSINIIRKSYPLIKIIKSNRGLTLQRNIGIKNLSKNSDIVLFLDDDIVLNHNYIEEIIKCYKQDIKYTIGGVEGSPVIDGKYVHPIVKNPIYQKIKSLYGCNMSYRVKAIENEYFDENLKTYAWLEDLDFSLRIGKKYKLVHVNTALCNHYASPRSRVAERKYGYMQLANWFYLSTKNKIPTYTTIHTLLYPLKNVLRIYKPTYRERLIGNLKAIKNILINYNKPEILLSEKI